MQNPNQPGPESGSGAQSRPEFQIIPAFSIPMVDAHMSDCDGLNRELRDLFVQRAAEGERYSNDEPRVRRNKSLFESRFDLFDWPDSCVQRLNEFCMKNLYRAIQELNGYTVETLQNMHMAVESWFHLTHQGGYFGAHNHPLHSWSGVYCVKHDGDDPASDSGKLTFINPNIAGTMYIDTASARFKRPYSMAPIMLRLVPGQLVLFPSWLLHEVMPYEGDSERITVAFNAKFKYAGRERVF